MLYRFKKDPTNKQTSNAVKTQKPAVNKKPEKPERNTSPAKFPKKALSDRLPKGLEEDMEADSDHAEQNASKQGRINKLNKK